jgi:tRNA dimethylallyltransferase
MAKPILIAGPTASGKSRLAFEIAKRVNGMIINADSMQVYAELRILTARPSDAELEAVPHRLYGHVPVSQPYSVGRWISDIASVLLDARGESRRPIIVGGTGLYFRALTRGLAEVPNVPASIRADWRERAATLSTAELHDLLAKRSSNEAARIGPSDRSRILRALEVIDATGRTLPEWQDEAAGAALIPPEEAEKIVITPPRAELYDRINRRFLTMMKAGALEEARKIAALDLDPELPAMKSIGLAALLAHLAGEIDIDEAIARAQTETRNYAKRQMTWFRNQMPDWPAADYPAAEELLLSRLG